MFKVDDRKDGRTVSVKAISFDCLATYFYIYDSVFLIKLQAFNLIGSSRVCFYFHPVIKSVLVKLQAFTVNDINGGL